LKLERNLFVTDCPIGATWRPAVTSRTGGRGTILAAPGGLTRIHVPTIHILRGVAA